jgi:hypothetical protein
LPIIPSEEVEQANIVAYLELLKNSWKVCEFTAIPNSTYTPYIWVKRKQIRQGLRAWLPDLFIICNTKKLIKKWFFIEMKISKWWVVRENQKKWIELINNTFWLKRFVCNWFIEAKEIIDNYINND